MNKFKVITLCGSTRYKEAFLAAQSQLTLDGYIVLSVGLFGHADNISLSVEEKAMLDEMHLEKILMAEKILVINPTGYYGESTTREIEFAYNNGKKVEFLVPPKEDGIYG